MAYLIDTSVFIHAKNFHYGFDFCPAFWDWIDQANRDGIVLSVRRVYEEIRDGDDDLAEWAKVRARTLFVDPDESINESFRAVSDWTRVAGYSAAQVAAFLDAADYYLVAHGHADDHVVVTHEVVAPRRNKIKIPDACRALGVECITPFQMLRAEGARFVLPS